MTKQNKYYVVYLDSKRKFGIRRIDTGDLVTQHKSYDRAEKLAYELNR